MIITDGNVSLFQYFFQTSLHHCSVFLLMIYSSACYRLNLYQVFSLNAANTRDRTMLNYENTCQKSTGIIKMSYKILFRSWNSFFMFLMSYKIFSFHFSVILHQVDKPKEEEKKTKEEFFFSLLKRKCSLIIPFVLMTSRTQTRNLIVWKEFGMLSILKVIYEEYTLGISEKMINQDFLEDTAFFCGTSNFCNYSTWN